MFANGSGADPRDIITPDAFQVLPALYGQRLASPWRRLGAIAIDGVIVAVIAQSGGIMLALALAIVVYSAIMSRGAFAPARRAGLRKLTGVTMAVVVFGAGLAIIEPLWQRLDRVDRSADGHADAASDLDFSAGDALRFGAALTVFMACDDAACRTQHYPELVGATARARVSEQRRAEVLAELVAEATKDPAERTALAQVAGVRAEPAAAGESLPSPPSAPTDAVRSEEREEQSPRGFSLLETLERLADDLGFSFGWGAVYFTVLTVLWDGQTLGKRWLGIRVISLRGEPLTYWAAFERYGGYAAGLATGLLGFLQVFWDANRQAIHDRICFTAVICDPGTQPLATLRARPGAPTSERDAQAQAERAVGTDLRGGVDAVAQLRRDQR